MSNSWSRIECEVIVADYLVMLYAECRGETYSKAEHRRLLKQQLQSRSDGSIEYKHQNISAILLKADHVYIRGYKPAWNYQALLEEVVMSRLEQTSKDIHAVEDTLSTRLPEQLSVPDLHSLFVSPPEMKVKHGVREKREFKPKRINYAEKEARNRTLGQRGEEFVLGACRTWHRNASHQGHPVNNNALFLGHEEDLRLFSGGKSVPINFSSPQGMHSLQIPSNADQTPFTLNGV